MQKLWNLQGRVVSDLAHVWQADPTLAIIGLGTTPWPTEIVQFLSNNLVLNPGRPCDEPAPLFSTATDGEEVDVVFFGFMRKRNIHSMNQIKDLYNGNSLLLKVCTVLLTNSRN